MDALYLIHLQLELECIGVDANGLLVRIPGENPDDIARFFIAHHASGYSRYCRDDLDLQIIEQLRALPPKQAFEEVETVKRILYGSDTTRAAMWSGSSYYFAAAPSHAASPDVLVQAQAFVVLRDGDVVSQAWSARSNSKAAELAVETVPAFRRQGYARQVAVAWARYQLAQGKVAFYSHVHQNVASQALAQSLGVVPFMDIVSYR